MNYHTDRREDDDETIVIQMVCDVRRLDSATDGEFRFPLKEHYDRAFNMPEGWLDSWWREQPTICRMPTSDDEGAPLNPSDELLRARAARLGADPDGLPDSTTMPPNTPDLPSGVQDSAVVSKNNVCCQTGWKWISNHNTRNRRYRASHR
jgi:hypothetical protein